MSFLVSLFIIVILAGNLEAQSPAADDPRIPPEVLVQAGDYRAAREAFTTHLVKHGGSPQRADSVQLDATAERVAFRSGAAELAAWISRPGATRARRPAVLFLHGGFAFKSPTRLYYGTRELHWDLSTRALVELARAKGLDVNAEQVEGGHESAVPEAMSRSIQFFQQAGGPLILDP